MGEWNKEEEIKYFPSIARDLFTSLSSFMIIRCNRQAIVCRGVMKGLVKTGS